VRRELALTDDQATKLRATQDRFMARRQPVMRRQRELRLALHEQMRPGVAANPDSVRRLMDAMHSGRAELVKLEEEQDREMAGYLTPVQRARFQMLRERFVQRVQELRRDRPGRDGRRMRPGGGPPRRPRQ
jgi:Spy/CpxP family protein refolding chaperone